MIKKLLIFLVVLLFLGAISVYFTIGFPIVFKTSKIVYSQSNDEFQINDTIRPLGLKANNLSVYLVFDNFDIESLPKNVKKSKVLFSKDVDILKDLISNFTFVKTGGDMTTCESNIYIFSSDSLIFTSQIVINENKVGIQSSSFGWCDATNSKDLIKIFEKFDRVIAPFVFI